MHVRTLAVSLFVAGITTVSRAEWTVSFLHPDGAVKSVANAVRFGKQGGSVVPTGTNELAAFWSGVGTSYVDLNPNGATSSSINCLTDTKQGGWAGFPTAPKAGIWSGTKASFVNLHPAGFSSSFVTAIVGDMQFGEAFGGGRARAASWNGTAASFVSLHPNGTNLSSSISDAAADQQVGWFQTPSQTAAIWHGTPESCVSIAPAGSSNSIAVCTTGSKQGGTAMFNGRYEAGIWAGSSESWTNLHPGGASGSTVSAMTENFQAGHWSESNLYRACYWSGTRESFVDLHSKLPLEYDQSFVTDAWSDGVTDYIAGFVQNGPTNGDNQRFAVLWTRPAELGFTFSLNKGAVAGQNSVQGTISMAVIQPTNTVFTTFDNSSLVTTPASVTVPANTALKNFQITVTAVNSTINTTVYARRMSVTHSRPLTLTPLIPTAIAFNPNPAVGGTTIACRVVINGVAGPQGRTIAVFDTSPFTTMPATITVPPGANQVTFNIETTAVPSAQLITITARVSAGEKTAILRLNP